MNKNIYTILFLLLIGCSAFAQTPTRKAYLKKAEQEMSQKNYYAALTLYLDLVKDDPENVDYHYKAAESARLFNSYDIAETHYQYVTDSTGNGEYPLAGFYLAEQQQLQGNYKKAAENYNTYLLEHTGDDEYYTFKADKERSACEWADAEDGEKDESMVVSNAGKDINTIYSDFAPTIMGDELFYSSMRFESKSGSSERVTKVLKTDIPANITDAVSGGSLVEGGFNSEMNHTGNTAFNRDNSKVFYTVCDRINGAEVRCDLYCRMINSDGTYGEAKKLPDFINVENSTTTHPSIGYDAEKDKEILYFVSDREGGKGKLDIYYSIIDNKDNFTNPKNLESINTKEDELTPFFHIPSSTLYFSSDGYRSYGGYDVYSSKVKAGNYSEPSHFGTELNSSYHDIYFVMSEDENSGYFATNREGAQYIDEIQKACCFDIYKVEFKDLDLKLDVLTYEKIKGNPDLIGANVRLINEDTGELVGEITNETGISHEFDLERCTNYLIIGEKVGYTSDTIRYSTCGLKKSQKITKKLFLKPNFLELDVFTFDEKTRADLNGCTVVLTDVTDPSVPPISFTFNDKNLFNYKLIRGHQYKIAASRPGYYPASIDIFTEDVTGTKIVRNIYLKKDEVTVLRDILPVKLYFDNDHPNPKTTRRSTKLLYSETYNRYLTRQSTFERRSADPVLIKSFFVNDVVGGYNNLNRFLREVQPLLAQGMKFEISIKGFASPLSQTDYNLYLGQRRISSIMNEIRNYNGGALIPYLTSSDGSTAALIITDISYGETLSPKDISDSRKNTRESIYSEKASRERRVEIIDVTRQQN